MIPKKIIFYTRDTQTPFHCALARQLLERFPEARVLFASFFSQSIAIARAEGFETFFFPDALRVAQSKSVSEERLRQIDIFCQSEGMGLNAMLNTERFLPKDRSEARVFRDAHLAVLDEIVEEATLGVSTMYDHFIYLAAGMITHFKGGSHFAFVGCGMPSGRIVGLRTPWETWQNHQSTDDPVLLLEKSRNEMFLPSEERIEYMKKPSLTEERSLPQRLSDTRLRRQYARENFKAGSYFPTDQRNWIGKALRWRLNGWIRRVPPKTWDIRSIGDLDQLKNPTVFLALHMEPEATILMYSPRLRDQVEASRLVSEALPVGYILLVKENPKMIGRRPRGFYDAIKRYPNVRLVSIEVPSAALIEHCRAVVSLAGTVTVEARLHGKPAFCFGRPPFRLFASATGAECLDQLQTIDSLVARTSGSPNSGDFKTAWEQWVLGTFKGSTGPKRFHPMVGRPAYNATDENVSAYRDFIVGVLETKERKRFKVETMPELTE